MNKVKTKNNKESFDNDYALDVRGDDIYIEHAESGRKGYSCKGCGKAMVAVRTQIEGRRSYFRHDAEAVKRGERKCTYTSEDYRHEIAQKFLLEKKEVKVPALYKSHPNDNTAPRRLIKKAEVLIAHSVDSELYFFEDDEKVIKWAKSVNLKQKKDLLIKPDVIFFNEEGKPILLIEIIATHGIDKEKLTRINRLAIDTIQIKIPKGSPEDIENALSRTNGTKWIFNYEQKTTSYVQLSNRNSERLPPIDEFERKLLETEESFYCRENELNNILRKIGRCLETERYRRVDKRIRGDLFRVKNITEEHRLEWKRIQAEQDEAIERELEAERRASYERIERRRTALRERRGKFKTATKLFKIKRTGLEGRYRTKKRSLEGEEKNYRPRCQQEIERIEVQLEQLGGEPKTLAEQISDIETQTRRIGENIGKEMENIEQLRRSIESTPSEFKAKEKKLELEFEQSKKAEQRRFEELRAAIGTAVRERNIERIEGYSYSFPILGGLIQAEKPAKAIQLLESQKYWLEAITRFGN